MSLAGSILSRVFSSESADPLEDVDFEAPHVGVYELVARDVDGVTPWGRRTLNGYEPGPGTRGSGFLMLRAFDELKRDVDPDDHRGEVVGTVAIDVDEWTYTVRREVDDE